MLETSVSQPYQLVPVVQSDRFVDSTAVEAGKIRDTQTLPLISSSFPSSKMPFKRTSHVHGRSVEDPSNIVFNTGTIIDENGDIFTAFSIKGSDVSRPSMHYYPIEPSGVRINGMLDASTFERCLKVSRYIRKEGVLTEFPILHARPKRFPFGEHEVGLLQLKSSIFEDYHAGNEALRKSEYPNRADSIGTFGLVAQGLLDMQFGVMYRAMLSNVRISELSIFSEGPRSHYVAEAIKSLQLRKPDYLMCWENLRALDPDSQEDQRTYLTTVLPQIMGENLARFHNADCYHKYLHPGNWTLAGEIVDLDSVSSPTLFPEVDDEITIKDRLSEVFCVGELLQLLSSASDNTPSTDLLGEYYRGYFSERYLQEGLGEVESIILESQSYLLSSDDLLDPQPTRIIDISPSFIANSLQNAFEEFGLVEEITDSNERILLRSHKSTLLAEAYRQVSLWAQKNNISEDTPGLNINLIASVELYKLNSTIDVSLA